MDAQQNNEGASLKHRSRQIMLSVLLLLGALVYWPGITGPYIFDDYSNLLGNSYVKIQTLDLESLYHAAFSLDAGPLQRPIPMVSFALNHYFSGSFANPAAYKITNLAIHAINGLLIFWLAQLIMARSTSNTIREPGETAAGTPQSVWLAFATAMLWVVHPMQITSVLYLVQRMTELSALFVLSGLILYMKGRAEIDLGQGRRGIFLITIGLMLFGTLGMLSKETAILLPVFVLVLEFALFSSNAPWNRWHSLPLRQRRLLITGLLAVTVILLVLAILYALPAYENRSFNILQRLLTEGRVLFIYLSLLLLPQINRFGHQHDDIVLSTSLLDPWTTMPALLGHAGILVIAVLIRKRLPLLSLGILWFYAGHLLESTIFALEIAHEHRNYLPSFGIMLGIAGGLQYAATRTQRPRLIWLLPLLTVFYAAVCLLRAGQWGNEDEFYRYEALHHPNSARLQAEYARALLAQGNHNDATQALLRAHHLDPSEASYLIQVLLIQALQGRVPDASGQEQVLQILRTNKNITMTTVASIAQISSCLPSHCRLLAPSAEQWLRTILDQEKSFGDRSFFHHALGQILLSQNRVNDAIAQFQRSHQLDPRYLHPLFELAKIYIRREDITSAERTLAELIQANRISLHPRTREIEFFAADIARIKTGAGKPSNNNRQNRRQ